MENNIHPMFKEILKSISPKSVLDGADVHKHAQAIERLKTLAENVKNIDPVDLWDVRDDLIQASKIAEVLLLFPNYYVAVSRDVISHDGPEIHFFQKKENMDKFVERFKKDMFDSQSYKNEEQFLQELKEDEEDENEFKGEDFFFFPYTYFSDDVQLKWGPANTILTLKD